MKHKLTILTGAGLLALTSLAGAQQATTDPVGYITLPVTAGPNTQSLIGPTLVNKVEFSGVVTAASGNTLTVADNSFTAGQFGTSGFYVEITNGTNAGVWTDITGNTANTITTSDNISSLITANATTIKIRKHHTIASLFGENNAAGFQGGTSLEQADGLLLLNAATQQTTTIFFSTDDLNPGWVDTQGNPAGGTIVAPGSGILVTRRAGTPLNLVQVGHVKTGKTVLPIEKGDNIVTIPLAAGVTYANSNLDGSGLAAGVSLETADVISSLTNGALSTVFKSTDDLNPGWVTTQGQNVDTAVLSEGTSVIISRRGDAFNWVAPSAID